MKWQQQLKYFSLRFAICVVVLGGIYLAVLTINRTSHNRGAMQRIANLRAALDETYIAATELANFKQSDPATDSILNTAFSRLENAQTTTQKRLNETPEEVSPTVKNNIKKYLDRQKEAQDRYKSSYGIFQKVLSYDPETDLGKLNINKETDKLANRARAAEKGLYNLAENKVIASSASGLNVEGDATLNTVVNADVKQAATAESTCMRELASQVDSKQVPQSEETRRSCINSYPSLRLMVVRNITGNSFSKSYQDYMKKAVIPLLKQLDDIEKAN